MKRQLITAAGILAVLSSGNLFAEDAIKPECTTVVDHLTAEVKKDPSRLLLIVEDALTLNDKCACEIVSTAIKISKADAELVGRIVTTSVQAAPTAASTIGECALAASPNNAAAIKKSMAAALGQGDTGESTDTTTTSSSGNGKEVLAAYPTSGKEVVAGGKEVVPGGKGVVDPGPGEDPGEDAYGAPLNTAGVYLYTPAGSAVPVVEKETRIIIRREEKVIRRVVVRPTTR